MKKETKEEFRQLVEERMKNRERVGFFNSIKTNIVFLVLLVVIITAVICRIPSIPMEYMVAALIAFMVVAYFVISMFVNPIIRISRNIGAMADMDFRDDGVLDALGNKKDEVGIMARALIRMREEMKTAIEKIRNGSSELYEAAQSMNKSASQTAESVGQVDKAISEIAQGATSQAQETQTATENVILMGNMIEDTNTEIEDLRNSARAMRSAGENAMKILGELNKINQQTKDAISVIYEQTNTTNTSAMRIKEATNIITDIAEETNLLSLNASIEAARAGEQGRGFAVVASQIQKLAEQSNESARQIALIIDELISDSAKSVETMEEVKEVIKKQDEYVSNTEASFNDVNDGIAKSIDGIHAIAVKTKDLDGARVKVVDVVQNLTAIAEENAASTEETSASAAEVGNTIGAVAQEAKHLNVIANDLDENIKVFIMD